MNRTGKIKLWARKVWDFFIDQIAPGVLQMLASLLFIVVMIHLLAYFIKDKSETEQKIEKDSIWIISDGIDEKNPYEMDTVWVESISRGYIKVRTFEWSSIKGGKYTLLREASFSEEEFRERSYYIGENPQRVKYLKEQHAHKDSLWNY